MRPAQGHGNGNAGSGGRGGSGGGTGSTGGSGATSGTGTTGSAGGTGGTGNSGGRGGEAGKGGAARTRPPQTMRPGPPRSRPPSTMQPAPPTVSGDSGDSGDSGPWDAGFFYLYDNTSPESDYVAGEPCRIVCQSDPSVQCSSYAGQCSGLPDRLICDGQTVMCPASAAPHQTDPTGQADQITQSDPRCADRPAGHDQGQAKTDSPCNVPAGATSPVERCEDRRDGGRHHGQGKAAVSCSGAKGTP